MNTRLNKNSIERMYAYAKLHRRTSKLADKLVHHPLASGLNKQVIPVVTVLWSLPSYTSRFGLFEDWADEVDKAWGELGMQFKAASDWEKLDAERGTLGEDLQYFMATVFGAE